MMNGLVALVALLLLAASSEGVFDAELRQALLRGNLPAGIDTSNTVTCRADAGRDALDAGRDAFDVPLVAVPTAFNGVTRPDSTWVPQVPDYIQIPAALNWVNKNVGTVTSLLSGLQGINMNLQKLSETEVDLNSDINVGGTTAERATAANIVTACSAVYNSTTDIDSKEFAVDITIVDTTNNSDATGITFATDMIGTSRDQINSMEDLFESLRCRVIYRFIDLGPAFLPRYMVAGRCFSRSCSFPIDEGQTCRADLGEILRLPALRYDCCWEARFKEDTGAFIEFQFNCGWRPVNVPILCDCDCSCPPST